MSSRRSFLSRLLAGTLAAVTLPVLYAIGRYLQPPKTTPASLVLDLSLLPNTDGSPHVVKLGIKDVAVIRVGGTSGIGSGEIYAMSLACTHMGCGVGWNERTREFICPCHAGVFAADGSVVSGPATRPLEQLRVEVRDRSVRITDDVV